MMRTRWMRRGQSITEYAILLGTVSVAMLSMNLFLKRGIQAAVKNAADGLSPYSNDAAKGNDATGDWAQIAGLKQETGDPLKKATSLGRVLESRSSTAVEINPNPGDFGVRKTRRVNGELFREVRQVQVMHPNLLNGTDLVSRSGVIVDDSPTR